MSELNSLYNPTQTTKMKVFAACRYTYFCLIDTIVVFLYYSVFKNIYYNYIYITSYQYSPYILSTSMKNTEESLVYAST